MLSNLYDPFGASIARMIQLTVLRRKNRSSFDHYAMRIRL